MAVARTQAELTAPFWEAVNQGQLVRPVCGNCQSSFFSPQVVCPSCQLANWTYQPSAGTGTVYSHTTIHRPPDPSFEAPYVVADIELDEGWRMFSWIVNCKPSEAAVDMAVAVCFVDGPNGRRLPAFAPKEIAAGVNP